jgi:hypothetical protein
MVVSMRFDGRFLTPNNYASGKAGAHEDGSSGLGH